MVTTREAIATYLRSLPAETRQIIETNIAPQLPVEWVESRPSGPRGERKTRNRFDEVVNRIAEDLVWLRDRTPDLEREIRRVCGLAGHEHRNLFVG
jgi:hypothetical protein